MRTIPTSVTVKFHGTSVSPLLVRGRTIPNSPVHRETDLLDRRLRQHHQVSPRDSRQRSPLHGRIQHPERRPSLRPQILSNQTATSKGHGQGSGELALEILEHLGKSLSCYTQNDANSPAHMILSEQTSTATGRDCAKTPAKFRSEWVSLPLVTRIKVKYSPKQAEIRPFSNLVRIR